MGDLAPSRQCRACSNFNGAIDVVPGQEKPPAPQPREMDGPETFSCNAFPEGIPGAILREDFDHRKPHQGDGGVRFVAIDQRSAKVVEQLFGGD